MAKKESKGRGRPVSHSSDKKKWTSRHITMTKDAADDLQFIRDDIANIFEPEFEITHGRVIAFLARWYRRERESGGINPLSLVAPDALEKLNTENGN